MINFIIKRIKNCHKRKQLTYELNSYTDRELADIGLSRADIPNIVKESLKNEE